MRVRKTPLRAALLGSTLALVALTTAAGARDSRADLERILAATGRPMSAPPAGSSAAIAAPAQAGHPYTVLHSFAGAPGDGNYSTAPVTLDASGNIYGTTDDGGANNTGTLFEITSGGTESIVHSFGGTGDGTQPDGAVIFDASGNMYGTTEYGGASNNGTIWELAADGTYSILHNFTTDEGNYIRGRLLENKKGNFYGTALFGGANGYGTVFKYGSGGTLTVLHTFDGSDGMYAEHGVVADKKGNLYGVTAFGGTSDDGTVYKIARDGTFTTLYNFTGGADGGFLYGGLAIDKNGNVYGSTVSGGTYGVGTVFKMTSAGTLTTLYSFTNGADGGAPYGDMVLVGKNLYSTTTTGAESGCDAGCGTAYELTPTGKLKVLADFSSSNGWSYSASELTPSGKTFYGTTEYGGTDGDGVVFSLTRK